MVENYIFPRIAELGLEYALQHHGSGGHAWEEEGVVGLLRPFGRVCGAVVERMVMKLGEIVVVDGGGPSAASIIHEIERACGADGSSTSEEEQEKPLHRHLKTLSQLETLGDALRHIVWSAGKVSILGGCGSSSSVVVVV